LKNLTELRLAANKLTDISVLADKTALQVLSLNLNRDIGDVSALANLTQLTTLTMPEVPIADSSLLADKVKLTYLDVGTTGLTDTGPTSIGFLANLTAMAQLVLAGNAISDITMLEDLDKLEHVDLDFTNVTDITPLANNPGIGQGDTVFVQQMSYADCMAHVTAAQALLDRGVVLLTQCP
jgi:internalin A